MNVVIRKQAVYIRPADVLFVEVVHRDIRIVFEDHAGDDFISDMEIFPRAVLLDVFPHLHDFARSLVP